MDEITRGSVAVFGSSQASRGTPNYILAGDLGRELALLGAEVRCGGYGGVMEAVATGARQAGGRVTGCTLEWFQQTRVPFSGLDEVHECRNLHSRIECLLKGARGAVVLPGGVGTFNELFWVWTLLMHDRDEGPAALVLLGAQWDELLGFLSHHFEFTDPIRGLVRVALTAKEAAGMAWAER